MRLILMFLILVCNLCGGIDWYGYFEHENDYAVLPESNLYFGYNKLRMDFSGNIHDRVHVGGNIISKFYHGKKNWNIMNYIPPEHYPRIPVLDDMGNMQWDTLSYYPYAMADTTFLDNAFIHVRMEYLDITVGKQQISPGVGYAWNPVDVFNIKDIMDPTYEQTGVNALRLSFPLTNQITVDGIWQPQSGWSSSKQHYQVKSRIGRFDASMVYVHTAFSKTGLLSGLKDSRDLYGVSLEGELAGIGVRSEFALNKIPQLNKDWIKEYIFGADYTFESGFYVLSEFYHNDFGVRKEDLSFDEYMTVFLGERKSLNRDYLFLLGMFPLLDIMDFKLFTIYNFNDKSMVINPEIVYRIYQDVELIFTGNIFDGNKTSEFGYQDCGFRLRFRAYF
jgi:hypothetical protein